MFHTHKFLNNRGLIAIFFIHFITSIFAQTTCTSTGSGTWSSSFNCSGSGTPITYHIQSGDSITTNSNVNSIDTLVISGYLEFTNGTKLELSDNGVIIVNSGGEIGGGNAGSRFIFDNGSTIKGAFAINGPVFATENSGGFTSGSLPVTWVMVDAEITDQDIEVHWSTALELNNSHFEIQLLADTEDWETVGIEYSNHDDGNSKEIEQYQFSIGHLESKPINKTQHIYIRIKQVDFDGKSSYSPIVKVHKYQLQLSSTSLFPNPSSGNVYLSGISLATPFKVYDSFGVSVHQSTTTACPNTIQLHDLPNGIYYIHVIGQTQYLPFVLVNTK